jgi:hypothetical protein
MKRNIYHEYFLWTKQAAPYTYESLITINFNAIYFLINKKISFVN